MCYAFLICSLIANYLLWTGQATRPETISDYLAVIAESQPHTTPIKHGK
jgi:hypothetical protein